MTLISKLWQQTSFLTRLEALVKPLSHSSLSSSTCRQPTLLSLSLSAKVAAVLSLLEANLDFAASTSRRMRQHWRLWFQPQPRGLMSLVRFCLLLLWLQMWCLLCGCHMENERWDSRLQHTYRYFDFSQEMEEKQDNNTAMDKTQTN